MKKPLSVYVHIPFCEKKCGYCDFVSFSGKADLIDRYVDVLCDEIEYDRVADTVFIGGGTPSLLSNEQMGRIFSKLKVKKGAEITVEANPSSITEQKLRYWLALGVNRISIGVQSFDDEVLKILGRIHTGEQACRTILLAHEVGFRNINIDFMYGIPSAALGEIAIPSCVTHVSAYSLIIEKGTPFAKLYKAVSEEQSCIQQEQVESVLKINGFSKYEVSNFAKKGYRCRHNMAYWRPCECEYIGFGLSAHSLVDNRRFENTCDMEKYLAGRNVRKVRQRTQRDIDTEIVMLGLRTVRGVGVGLIKQKEKEIAMLKQLKLIKQSKGRISATSKGFKLLNMIIEKLT